MKRIVINKNRGWRGLAEVVCLDEENKEVNKMIFSFSQDMWDDLIYRHIVVIQDTENYYIIKFNDDTSVGKLPTTDQQRSVLIKNYIATVEKVNTYAKDKWTEAPTAGDYAVINHFRKNKNNHTTSDWNCIGIRVTPEI